MQISGNQEKNAHHIILFWNRMSCNSADKYSHVCGSIQQLNSKHTNSVKRCSVFKCGWTINYLLYKKTKTDFDSETSSTFTFTIFLNRVIANVLPHEKWLESIFCTTQIIAFTFLGSAHQIRKNHIKSSRLKDRTRRDMSGYGSWKSGKEHLRSCRPL